MVPTEDWIGPLKTGLYFTEYGLWAALTRTALLPLIMIMIIIIIIIIIIIVVIIIIIVVIIIVIRMIIKSYKIRNTFTRFFLETCRIGCLAKVGRVEDLWPERTE